MDNWQSDDDFEAWLQTMRDEAAATSTLSPSALTRSTQHESRHSPSASQPPMHDQGQPQHQAHQQSPPAPSYPSSQQSVSAPLHPTRAQRQHPESTNTGLQQHERLNVPIPEQREASLTPGDRQGGAHLDPSWFMSSGRKQGGPVSPDSIHTGKADKGVSSRLPKCQKRKRGEGQDADSEDGDVNEDKNQGQLTRKKQIRAKSSAETKTRKPLNKPSKAEKRTTSSVRGAKIAELKKRGEVGANDRLKKPVKVRGGIPHIKIEDDWVAAGYHSSFRDEFIEMDKAENVPYVHDPDHGEAANDITSRCTAHSTWTPDLNTIQNGNHERLLEMPQPAGFRQEDAPTWRHCDQTGRELIVIDRDHNPVRAFKDIPRVLSSKTEGYRLEGMRRMNGMTYMDIMARMPPTILVKGAEKPLYLRSAIGARIDRLRNNNHFDPWKSGKTRKEGTEGDTRRKRADGKKLSQKDQGEGRVATKLQGAQQPQAHVDVDVGAGSGDRPEKHRLEDEETPKDENVKRRRGDEPAIPNKEMGTAAQHALAQIRQNPTKTPHRRIEGRVSSKQPPKLAPNMSKPDGLDVAAAFHGLADDRYQRPYADFGSHQDSSIPPASDPFPGTYIEDSTSLPDPHKVYQNLYSGPVLTPGAGLQGSQYGSNQGDPSSTPYQSTPYQSTPGLTPDVHAGIMSRDLSSTTVDQIADMAYDFGPVEPQNINNRPEIDQGKASALQDTAAYPLALDNTNPVPDEIQHHFHQDFVSLPQDVTLATIANNLDHEPEVPSVLEYDFRDWIPMDQGEMNIIQENALLPTLHSFFQIHDDAIPPTIPELSYQDNLVIIKAEHQRLCQEKGIPVTPLVGLGPWYRFLDNWRTAEFIVED